MDETHPELPDEADDELEALVSNADVQFSMKDWAGWRLSYCKVQAHNPEPGQFRNRLSRKLRKEKARLEKLRAQLAKEASVPPTRAEREEMTALHARVAECEEEGRRRDVKAKAAVEFGTDMWAPAYNRRLYP